MKAIEVNNLKKSYGTVEALKGINFDASKGEILGIIGPDGSGKTTLFRILTTLLLADAGAASVLGYDLLKDYQVIRRNIGYMPGKFSLYQDLTIEENLTFFATLFNTTIEENYHLIEGIYKQIEPFKDRRAGKLSGGMKQKLALCCALIHKPEILFLDEPTTGVDPVSRKEFWEMLKDLKKQDICILVSTPYMDEASMCDRIAFIQEGQFLDIDSPEQIIKKFKGRLLAVEASELFSLLHTMRQIDGVISCFAFGENLHAVVQDGLSEEALHSILIQKGYSNLKIEEITPSIEDCFMQITGDIHE